MSLWNKLWRALVAPPEQESRPHLAKLRQHVAAHTPRCLAGVRTERIPLIEDRGAESIALRLSGEANDEVGEVLGYDLCDYNPSYDGPSEFISPLAIGWPNSPPTVIFDSDIHGYHGEIDSSAKLRGVGEPKRYKCAQCGGTNFVISVQLDYWDACNDLWEDEPDVAIENYFCNIIVSGECVACRHVSRVLDMDL